MEYKWSVIGEQECISQSILSVLFRFQALILSPFALSFLALMSSQMILSTVGFRSQPIKRTNIQHKKEQKRKPEQVVTTGREEYIHPKCSENLVISIINFINNRQRLLMTTRQETPFLDTIAQVDIRTPVAESSEDPLHGEIYRSELEPAAKNDSGLDSNVRGLLTKVQAFEFQENTTPTISALSPSVPDSSSKLTADYVTAWGADKIQASQQRQQVIGRFKSFDMTGMTTSPPPPSKPGVNKSPSGQSIVPALSRPSQKNLNPSNLKKINVVTKLPPIEVGAAQGQVGSSRVDSSSRELTASEQNFAYGPAHFVMSQPKDFILNNINNVPSYQGLNSLSGGKQSPVSSHKIMMMPISSGDAGTGTANPYSAGKLLLNVPSKLSNVQLSHQNSNLSQINEQDHSVSPPRNDKKYPNEKEKWIANAKTTLKQAKELSSFNQYSPINYGQENKKLKYLMPGEQTQNYYEKTLEERLEIQQHKTQSHIEKTYDQKHALDHAMKQSYKVAMAEQTKQLSDKKSFMKNYEQNLRLRIVQDTVESHPEIIKQNERSDSITTHGNKSSVARGGQMRQTMTQTDDENLLESDNSPSPTPNLLKDHSEKQQPVPQTLPIVVQSTTGGVKVKPQLLRLAMSEDMASYQMSSARVNPGQIKNLMGGIQSVQHINIMPQGNQYMSRNNMQSLTASVDNQSNSLDFGNSYLPDVVNKFLTGKQVHKKASRTQRPRTLQPIRVDRKQKETSITNARVRHHSLFSDGQKLASLTRKYANASDNAGLRNLSQDIRQLVDKKSVTSLTGVHTQKGLYDQFDDFIKNDRLHAFKVEDFYCLQKNVPALPEPKELSPRKDKKLSRAMYQQSLKMMRESMRQFAKDNDVIHVTIDKSSLEQLTRLSELEIKKESRVQLVTKKEKEAQERMQLNQQSQLRSSDMSNSAAGQTGQTGTEKMQRTTNNTMSIGSNGFKSGVLDKIQLKRVDEKTEEEQVLEPPSPMDPGFESTHDVETAVGAESLTPVTTLKDAQRAAINKSSKDFIERKSSQELIFIQGDQISTSKRPTAKQSDPALTSKGNLNFSIGPPNKQQSADAQEQKHSIVINESQLSTAAMQKKKHKSITQNETVGKAVEPGDSIIEGSSPQFNKSGDNFRRSQETSKDMNASHGGTSGLGNKLAVFSKVSPDLRSRIESLYNKSQIDIDSGMETKLEVNDGVENTQQNDFERDSTLKKEKSVEVDGEGNSITGPLSVELPQETDENTGTGNKTSMLEKSPTDEMVTPAEQDLNETFKTQGGTPRRKLSIGQQVLIDTAKDSKGFNVVDSEELRSSLVKNQESARQSMKKDTTGTLMANQKQDQKFKTGQNAALFNKTISAAQSSSVQAAEAMAATFRDKELFQETRLSMKVGERSLKDSRDARLFAEGENHFHKMTPNRKARMVQHLRETKSGMLTPGDLYDLAIESQIKQLDKQFRHVNFGMQITQNTFDEIMPRTINKEENITLWRDWMRRAIIFKREQLEIRINAFAKNFKDFKHERQRTKDYRDFAQVGYDKERSLQLSQLEIPQDFLKDSGSQLFILDGTESHMSSPTIKNVSQVLQQKQSSNSGVGMNIDGDLEAKVRQLLARTELKEIAETAKVLVEVSESANQSNVANTISNGLDKNKKAQSLMASKIQMSPRVSKKVVMSNTMNVQM